MVNIEDGKINFAFVLETITLTSCSVPSANFLISPTALRGIIMPGIDWVPSGTGISA